jgi:hypothetical protein
VRKEPIGKKRMNRLAGDRWTVGRNCQISRAQPNTFFTTEGTEDTEMDMDGTEKDTDGTERDPLTGAVIGCAIEVHRELGPGLLESAYEKCLAREMEMNGIPFQIMTQNPFPSVISVSSVVKKVLSSCISGLPPMEFDDGTGGSPLSPMNLETAG